MLGPLNERKMEGNKLNNVTEEHLFTKKQMEIKEKFVRERGYWADYYNDFLQKNEGFFEAYLKLSTVPWKTAHIEPKVKELILIAINASVTHLHEPAIRIHMENAIKCGATQEEIMEVMQLTSALGIHACVSSIPILVEELKIANDEIELELTEKQQQLKDKFIKERGYWNELNNYLNIEPDFFEAYIGFSAFPWKNGVLEPKVKEFIYVAIDAATTHLYNQGTRMHLKNAMKYGATKDELMELFQLLTVLGTQTCTVGFPILAEVLKDKEKS